MKQGVLIKQYLISIGDEFETFFYSGFLCTVVML